MTDDAVLAKLNERVTAFERSSWTKATGYPRIPTVVTLPTAREEYRFRILGRQAAAGAADIVSICLKSAGDTYSWVQIAVG